MAQASAAIWYGIIWSGRWVDNVPEPLEGSRWGDIVQTLHPYVEVLSYGAEDDEDRFGFAFPASVTRVNADKSVADFQPMILLTHSTHEWEIQLHKHLTEKIGWKNPPKGGWHLTSRLSW